MILSKIYKYIKLYWNERRLIYKRNSEDIFTSIYRKKEWGENKNFTLYSGSGSHNNEIILPYINKIIEFLEKENLTILDLGCGDFNVGKHFINYAKEYIAVDVVEEVIKLNREKYSEISNLQFIKLDITKDVLPLADVVIIRQVLMHLSNESILNFIDNLKKYNYKYLIITESLPLSKFKSNLNKKTGSYSRVIINSGIVLEDSPFFLKFKHKKNLIVVKEYDSVIQTDLYQFY